jgi:perosamine synthetase
MREVPPTAGLPLLWRDFLPVSVGPFEQALAAFLNVPSVQVECSGTASLIVALTTLRMGSKRRQVLLPAYTCPLVALAVLHCGLDPVLCDLRPDHFDIDVDELNRLCGENTLAMIATHLGGRVADLAPVLEIARRTGAYVIEDAAQALGATWQGKPLGIVGDAGFYSLAVGKGLTLYEGGILLARDDRLRLSLQETSSEIIARKIPVEFIRIIELLAYAGLYRPSGIGLAYGLPLRRALRRGNLIDAVGDNFPAEIPLHRVGNWRKNIGARALRRLPDFLAFLEQQALRRMQRLAAIAGISVMADSSGTRGVWPFFMVLMTSRHLRDAALNKLWTSGLGVSRLYIHALPDYAYLAGKFGRVDVPNARSFAARMVSVSNSPWLDDEKFERICQILEAPASALDS